VAASYIFPSLWRADDLSVLYAVFSDSQNSFGEGFQVLGKGNIYGFRQVLQLPAQEKYSHTLTVGMDYKDFDETVGFANGNAAVKTPISYMPFSVSYAASLPDATGFTQFSGGVSMIFRGMVTERREFEDKRYRARGNYLIGTLGLERRQKLPADFGFYCKIDGQLADQPLIANEQYSAGGMTSVRGYKESEEVGDNAVHTMMELLFPELASHFNFTGVIKRMAPFIFYDQAYLAIRNPLPGTPSFFKLNGAGVGLRCRFAGDFALEADWGVALSATEKTDSGTQRGQFLLKYEF
jgi:hemolysin activation/secretion protein